MIRRAISDIGLEIGSVILLILHCVPLYFIYCSFCDCISILSQIGLRLHVSNSVDAFCHMFNCHIYMFYIDLLDDKISILSLFQHIYNTQSWSNYLFWWGLLSFYNFSEFSNLSLAKHNFLFTRTCPTSCVFMVTSWLFGLLDLNLLLLLFHFLL